MSSLPEDIVENILSRLPVKSILRFRCVCRNWCILFRNPKFIKMHLNHAIHMNNFNLLLTNDNPDENLITEIYVYSIDYNDASSSSSSPFSAEAVEIDHPFSSDKCFTQIYGSCNGLVCIEPRESVCIWNPSTKEYKQVPETPIEFPSPDAEDGYKTAYGFGFDHTIDDYKLLRIVGFDVGEVSEARVYTLGSNSWRNLGFIPYDFSDGRNSGLFVNGLLFWIATRHGIGSKSSRVIVSFDICDETFHELPLPNNYLTEHFILGLGVWDGKLCVLGVPYVHHHRDHYDVWIMKDDLWSRHLTITAEASVYYSCLIQVFQNGHVLLLGSMIEEDTDSLYVYDPKLERARNLKIRGLPIHFEMETYVGTLVSLNSGTYVGKEQNRKQEEEEED